MKILVIICIFIFANLCFGEDNVIYPHTHSDKDYRYLEHIELLKSALEKTKKEYGRYTLKESELEMNEFRMVLQGKQAEGINVIWTSTNREIEKELIPIRIPISKGILGYRIFIVKEKDKEKFKKLTSVDELKKCMLIQGRDWGDVKVFRENGFSITEGSGYEELFSMINEERFDYFSRGINEAYVEVENRKDEFPDLTVEESLALYYPWPYYFFVSPKTPEIAERIRKGLEIMIADGTYNKIFEKYNRSSIKKARLKGRKIFILNNPNLPESTPLDRKELWFTP